MPGVRPAGDTPGKKLAGAIDGPGESLKARPGNFSLRGALRMEHVVLPGLEVELRPGPSGRTSATPARTSAPALAASQAACIEALRKAGAASHSQIAIAAGLTRYKARSALLSLAGLGLAEQAPGNRWQLTRRGKTCRFKTVAERTHGSGGKLGRAARRALRALDRPMSGPELATRLGVTKQRADQLIVDLHAAGRIQLGDPERRTRIVARKDDPTPLLSGQEQRVLAAVPESYKTTVAKIRLAARCTESAAGRALGRLQELGLIAAEATVAGHKIYRLTAAGSAHPQYGRSAGRAAPPTLPVRSDRVCAVLALLAGRGQAQITDVRDALGVAQPSINALFQYLKRKALVRKDGEELRSPYVLTERGREVLAEMQRRRAG
jgi:DNA-binding MarR family transcriptional regulator